MKPYSFSGGDGLVKPGETDEIEFRTRRNVEPMKNKDQRILLDVRTNDPGLPSVVVAIRFTLENPSL